MRCWRERNIEKWLMGSPRWGLIGDLSEVENWISGNSLRENSSLGFFILIILASFFFFAGFEYIWYCFYKNKNNTIYICAWIYLYVISHGNIWNSTLWLIVFVLRKWEWKSKGEILVIFFHKLCMVSVFMSISFVMKIFKIGHLLIVGNLKN